MYKLFYGGKMNFKSGNIVSFASAAAFCFMLAACGSDSSSADIDAISSSADVEESSSSTDIDELSSSAQDDIEDVSSDASDKPASSSEKASQDSLSSSSTQRSSSSALPDSLEADPDSTVNVSSSSAVVQSFNYGTFVDERDSRTYKYITIGEGDKAQIWMAENLNYQENGYGICFAELSENCDKQGALYSWASAIDSISLSTDKDNPIDCGLNKDCKMPDVVQGVCPKGWHLPNKDEWATLFENVGGRNKAGIALKSTSGWEGNGNGMDEYGFTALAAGSAMQAFGMGLMFGDIGAATYYWASSPYSIDLSQAYCMSLKAEYDFAQLSWCNKIESFSVRCVTDSLTLATGI